MCSIGQQEVYDFLTQHKGSWFTSRDISEKLRVSIGSVTMSLKKLRKTNLIKYKNTGIRNTFIYTVEPEGVTVQPPPGIADLPEPLPEERPKLRKPERIIPKIVVPKKYVPIIVPRAREQPRPPKPTVQQLSQKKPARPASRKPARKTSPLRKAAPRKAPARTRPSRKPARKAAPRKAPARTRPSRKPTKAARRPVRKPPAKKGGARTGKLKPGKRRASPARPARTPSARQSKTKARGKRAVKKRSPEKRRAKAAKKSRAAPRATKHSSQRPSKPGAKRKRGFLRRLLG